MQLSHCTLLLNSITYCTQVGRAQHAHARRCKRTLSLLYVKSEKFEAIIFDYADVKQQTLCVHVHTHTLHNIR